MVPLITSIPPRMSRVDAAGVEIGPEYQRRCLDSWRAAGFDPISVNSKREPAPEGVAVVMADRDAEHITGRPHVFLADIIAAGARAARDGVFAIANADLIFSPSAGLIRFDRDVLLMNRRIDIADVEQRHGQTWISGFDLFAMHGNASQRITDIGLIFGAPWWDHWLPIIARQAGMRLQQTPPAVYHLNHADRWDWKTWHRLGWQFAANAKPLFVEREFIASHRDAASTGSTVGDAKRLIASAIPSRREAHSRAHLSRIAAANIAYIDAVSFCRTRHSSTGG